MKNPLPGIINEIRQVVWPTPKEMLGLFLFVIGISGVVAVMMLGLDYFFVEIREILLNL